MMKNCTEKGFTLVELMIVVVIIAILAAIAVPSYRAFMTTRRLNGAARQVMSHLMEARMKAVSLNQKVKVSFTSSHKYEIWNDASGDGTVINNEGDDIEIDIHPEYYDVIFAASASPVFQPRGTVSPASTVTLTNSGGFRYVKVSTAGRVKIDDTL